VMQSTSENPGSISSDPTLAETLGAAVRPADYSGLVRVERTHYVIGNEIARGGMGRILRARDRRLGRPVAIKEMLASASPGARARFEREVRITARLQHPSIVNVLEAGEWPDADPFYVMKLVSGESLDRAIARAETLEQRLALLPHVIAVVDALAYAHAQGVIHRDLKPGNVLVGEFGETVVIDWGLAKELTGAAPDGDDDAPPGASASTSGGETVAGSVVGTPAYMPPEQAEGEPADRRSDVYALGAILYQTVSGEAPFKGKSAEEVLAQVVSGDGPSVARTVPSLPPDLAAIIDKAMAFSPGDRYPSAKELAIDLKKFQTGQLVGAHRYSGWQLLRRWLQRNRTAVVVGAIATALLLVFGITALRGIMHERQQTERQRQVAEKNRGQAEELTSFMLGDLRTKLEPLGKLPLLEVVARKALAYYADRTDTMKPSELRRRAVALTNIGHVLSQQGACEEARVELDEAVAILERLSRANPLDPDVIHALAAARHERGELYWRQAKATEAIREYQANVDALAVPLVCGRDHEQDCRALLALALERIGFMEKGRGNLDAALAAFRRSRDVRSALDPTNAEWRLAMSMSHDAIAGVLDIRDELPAALTEYRTAAAIRTELVERAPGTLHYRFALAVSQDHIGTVLDVMGDSAAALQTFRDEVHTAEILTERDPTNAEWQELLGVA
ncbi:MAG TPA: serine/threonine-protein kinase, partial [Kofleriaceae bacterium]|nr:serine/threonine-protein kinase [Kofleriaceae bacterium]